MDLHLTFSHGKVTGEGTDDVGPFVVKGQYDAKNAECSWTKTYVGRHDVFYRGFREGKGIWGTWESAELHGGFHIWPRGSGEGEEETRSVEEPAPVEAIGKEETAPASAAGASSHNLLNPRQATCVPTTLRIQSAARCGQVVTKCFEGRKP